MVQNPTPPRTPPAAGIVAPAVVPPPSIEPAVLAIPGRPPSALEAEMRSAAAAPDAAMPFPATRSASAETMPLELRQQLNELEQWAIANHRDARMDAITFWSLKVPAILASASAGVLARFDLTTASLVVGATASVCVVIDGVHPRGMLRNIHLRAFHDVRILTSRMVSQWRSRSVAADDDNIARRIVRDAETERERIAGYIRDAETSLNFKNEA